MSKRLAACAPAVGGDTPRPLTKAMIKVLLLDSAEQHGRDSEPDHEVGDLQCMLGLAIDIMSDAQVRDLLDRYRDEMGLWSDSWP